MIQTSWSALMSKKKQNLSFSILKVRNASVLATNQKVDEYFHQFAVVGLYVSGYLSTLKIIG